MMVKAGIIVSAAAASLLAVSPLAFAGDYDGGNGHNKGHHSRSHHSNDRNDHKGDRRGNRGGDKSCTQDNSADTGRGRGGGGGLLNLTGNNIQVPAQVCNNNILNNLVVGVLSRGQSADSR
jgi:hypothetical protein